MEANPTTRERKACRQLRTRSYTLLGRDHEDMYEDATSVPYWCARTTTALGPDDVYCAPSVCRSGRACFEPEE
jgi:hypothetical protein